MVPKVSVFCAVKKAHSMRFNRLKGAYHKAEGRKDEPSTAEYKRVSVNQKSQHGAFPEKSSSKASDSARPAEWLEKYGL